MYGPATRRRLKASRPCRAGSRLPSLQHTRSAENFGGKLGEGIGAGKILLGNLRGRAGQLSTPIFPQNFRVEQMRPKTYRFTAGLKSEARRVGQECVRTCRYG